MQDAKRLLTYARHRHVVQRYQYWTEMQRRREDDVMKILAYAECFYEPAVIYKILKSFKPNPQFDAILDEETRAPKPKNNPRQASLF